MTTTIKDFVQFLRRVAEAAGLSALECDETGLVSLRVEDAYNVHLQFVAATGKILCFVEVAKLSAGAQKETVYRELLAGSLFGKDTAGGFFALEPDTETVIYNYLFDFDPAQTDPAAFAETLEKILSLVDIWAQRIGEAAAAASPPPANGQDFAESGHRAFDGFMRV